MGFCDILAEGRVAPIVEEIRRAGLTETLFTEIADEDIIPEEYVEFIAGVIVEKYREEDGEVPLVRVMDRMLEAAIMEKLSYEELCELDHLHSLQEPAVEVVLRKMVSKYPITAEDREKKGTFPYGEEGYESTCRTLGLMGLRGRASRFLGVAQKNHPGMYATELLTAAEGLRHKAPWDEGFLETFERFPELAGKDEGTLLTGYGAHMASLISTRNVAVFLNSLNRLSPRTPDRVSVRRWGEKDEAMNKELLEVVAKIRFGEGGVGKLTEGNIGYENSVPTESLDMFMMLVKLGAPVYLQKPVDLHRYDEGVDTPGWEVSSLVKYVAENYGDVVDAMIMETETGVYMAEGRIALSGEDTTEFIEGLAGSLTAEETARLVPLLYRAPKVDSWVTGDMWEYMVEMLYYVGQYSTLSRSADGDTFIDTLIRAAMGVEGKPLEMVEMIARKFLAEQDPTGSGVANLLERMLLWGRNAARASGEDFRAVVKYAMEGPWWGLLVARADNMSERQVGVLWERMLTDLGVAELEAAAREWKWDTVFGNKWVPHGAVDREEKILLAMREVESAPLGSDMFNAAYKFDREMQKDKTETILKHFGLKDSAELYNFIGGLPENVRFGDAVELFKKN